MNGSKPHKVPAAALGAAVALVIALALPASVANAAETNGTIPMAMPAGESATENSVIGCPITWARTADRRTACIERDEPSVQMK